MINLQSHIVYCSTLKDKWLGLVDVCACVSLRIADTGDEFGAVTCLLWAKARADVCEGQQT